MESPVPIIAKKLQKGSHLRVIAPAESFPPKFTEELKQKTIKGFEALGLKVTFGKYVHEINSFKSASLEHRLEDLHEAFEDQSIDAIISAIGGSSANQLLKKIDYDLVKRNPKIFCGLSDITELNSAIFAKTGLVTYYGPHFVMLGASIFYQQMFDNIQRMFFQASPFSLEPSHYYSNNDWEKEKIVSSGYWTLNTGEAEAQCLGGNLLTINFLTGYEYMPSYKNCILFLEENKIIDYRGIQKEVQQLLNHSDGSSIKGIVFGRFQRESKMSKELLLEMISKMEELQGIPVIGNVDCSHTAPMKTFPFGGKIFLKAEEEDKITLKMLQY